MPAVGGHDDVRLRHAHAAGVRQEAAPRLVRRPVRPRERADDPLVRAEHHVEHEREPRPVRGEHHVAVYRVPLQDPCPRPRVRDELRAVVRQHRLARRHAGQDALAPARVAREEVRLHEPLRDEKVRLHRMAVQAQAPARRQDPRVDEIRLVPRVVQDDALPRDDLLAELLDELVAPRRAVAARRDEQRDVDSGVSAAQPLEHRRHEPPRGNRARVVAQDHRRRPLPGRERLEPRRADRIVQRPRHLGRGIGGGGRQRRLVDAEHPLVGNVGLEPGAAVGNGNAHGQSPPPIIAEPCGRVKTPGGLATGARKW